MNKVKKIRNFGIAAHIDAGKTTTSERILKLTGQIHKIGEVHDGNATMDFMEQEKKRGITIQSASTQCEWKYTNFEGKEDNIIINLIDTPGHIDFTIEVERALRVLDGVIIVLEGVGGVQPQTSTVWRQRIRYGLPTIIFINKMDRMGSDFDYVIKSIDTKLERNIKKQDLIKEIQYIVLNIPVGLENNFSGVIDIITMQYYYWKEGELNFQTLPIPEEYKQKANYYREQLFDRLSIVSEEIFLLKIEEKEIPIQLIYKTIREKTIHLELVPIMCGASFKNKGIQQLLDAIAYYLPAPNERGNFKGISSKNPEINIERVPNENEPFSFFVFKIFFIEGLGELVLGRCYSGKIMSKTTIVNPENGKTWNVGRIYIMKINKYEEVKVGSTGDIFAFQGLRDLFTGNTLCAASDPDMIIFEKMICPKPVISQTITPNTKQDTEKLNIALTKIQKQDPTVIVVVDSESKETQINCMGSLHLEIICEQIRAIGINFTCSPPAINYNEKPKKNDQIDFELKKQTGGAGQYARITLSVEQYTPEERAANNNQILFQSVLTGDSINKNYVPSIKEGVIDSCKNAGALGRYPIIDCKFTLITGSQHSVDSSSHAFYSCAVMAVRDLMKKTGTILVEPIMKVFIYAPLEYIGTIIGDINSREGNIIENQINGNSVIISAHIPFRKMMTYIDTLRASTKGEGSYEMEFFDQAPIPESVIPSIIKLRENIHYKSS
jgi:elongation factor G